MIQNNLSNAVSFSQSVQDSFLAVFQPDKNGTGPIFVLYS